MPKLVRRKPVDLDWLGVTRLLPTDVSDVLLSQAMVSTVVERGGGIDRPRLAVPEFV